MLFPVDSVHTFGRSVPQTKSSAHVHNIELEGRSFLTALGSDPAAFTAIETCSFQLIISDDNAARGQPGQAHSWPRGQIGTRRPGARDMDPLQRAMRSCQAVASIGQVQPSYSKKRLSRPSVRYSRTNKAIARLASCDWHLSVEKLAHHFGYPVLMSPDLENNLDRLTYTTAAKTPWSHAWNETLDGADATQQSRTRVHTRCNPEKNGVPNDVTTAAAALGRILTSTNTKRKADRTKVAATPPTPESASGHEPKDRHGAKSGVEDMADQENVKHDQDNTRDADVAEDDQDVAPSRKGRRRNASLYDSSPREIALPCRSPTPHLTGHEHNRSGDDRQLCEDGYVESVDSEDRGYANVVTP
ncbi:hypothetical protein EK21DRAFT_95375 [Setomelanomma holmii]|uniref:Uncharacterized protein n=1 Tax=Setomelanomma holmii TaxID=210430 RepID=A0A9P4GUB8_9PLEO|nr:hypothetical protein EK21DRAFT_95375 [Setomelanomma holmii]